MTEIIIECDRPGAKLPRLYEPCTFAAWVVSGDQEWQLRSYEMMALCPDVVACLMAPSKAYKRPVRSVSSRFVRLGNWFSKGFADRFPLLYRVV